MYVYASTFGVPPETCSVYLAHNQKVSLPWRGSSTCGRGCSTSYSDPPEHELSNRVPPPVT